MRRKRRVEGENEECKRGWRRKDNAGTSTRKKVPQQSEQLGTPPDIPRNGSWLESDHYCSWRGADLHSIDHWRAVRTKWALAGHARPMMACTINSLQSEASYNGLCSSGTCGTCIRGAGVYAAVMMSYVQPGRPDCMTEIYILQQRNSSFLVSVTQINGGLSLRQQIYNRAGSTGGHEASQCKRRKGQRVHDTFTPGTEGTGRMDGVGYDELNGWGIGGNRAGLASDTGCAIIRSADLGEFVVRKSSDTGRMTAEGCGWVAHSSALWPLTKQWSMCRGFVGMVFLGLHGIVMMMEKGPKKYLWHMTSKGGAVLPLKKLRHSEWNWPWDTSSPQRF